MMVIRLLWMIPALIIVSMIAFFLSRSIPGDRVDTFLQDGRDQYQANSDFLALQKTYRQTARSLGLDQPLFYFSIHSHILPDTISQILRTQEREAAVQLALRTGDWSMVHDFRKSLYQLIHQAEVDLSQTNQTDIKGVQNELAFLLYEDKPLMIQRKLSALEPGMSALSSTILNAQDVEKVVNLGQKMEQSTGGMKWWPKFVWHGTKNQYHFWVSRVLQGDFGLSVIDSKPVFDKVKESLRWTLLLNGTALFMAFLIALPLGVWLASTKKIKVSRWVQTILFVLYAMPSFWLATIVVVFFTTPEYGAWLDWFPTQGLGPYKDAGSWFSKIMIISNHLFLPVFCLMVGSLAYISQQMRQAMSHELNADYFLFYRSFGLKKANVIWGQAFRNSVFPMITILGGAIPVLFSGSLIIEVIFNIPGMGRLMYTSILAKDWNVVFGVLLMVSAITMVSYLLADIAYQAVDPRVRSDHQLKKTSF